MAQVLSRILMLPIAVLREILRHLDTKVIIWDQSVLIGGPRGTWSGTWRMINSLRLRRRMGQESHDIASNPNYRFLDYTP